MPRQSLGNMLNPVELATEPTPIDTVEVKLPAVTARTTARSGDADDPTETGAVNAPIATTGGDSTRRLAAAPTLPDSETGADADADGKSTQGPKYLTLPRKETRLTDAQLDALTVLSRRINKRRGGAGERITDNTLIRVAVDLLLERNEELVGTTENELRNSVGLGPL